MTSAPGRYLPPAIWLPPLLLWAQSTNRRANQPRHSLVPTGPALPQPESSLSKAKGPGGAPATGARDRQAGQSRWRRAGDNCRARPAPPHSSARYPPAANRRYQGDGLELEHGPAPAPRGFAHHQVLSGYRSRRHGNSGFIADDHARLQRRGVGALAIRWGPSCTLRKTPTPCPVPWS